MTISFNTKKRIAVIDYKMCNLDSVVRALRECNVDAFVTNDHNEIKKAYSAVLPGVGSFDKGMRNIRDLHLDEILSQNVVEKGVPLLGICLGMQLLAQKGTEGGETQGLGFIDGEVNLLSSSSSDERIPHVGWNEVHFIQNSPLTQELTSGMDYYFVHSYQFICRKKENILASTPYCGGFTSMVVRDNIYGAQFHPEKSQKNGLSLLKRFVSL